jgi:hypothetical protein
MEFQKMWDIYLVGGEVCRLIMSAISLVNYAARISRKIATAIEMPRHVERTFLMQHEQALPEISRTCTSRGDPSRPKVRRCFNGERHYLSILRSRGIPRDIRHTRFNRSSTILPAARIVYVRAPRSERFNLWAARNKAREALAIEIES